MIRSRSKCTRKNNRYSKARVQKEKKKVALWTTEQRSKEQTDWSVAKLPRKKEDLTCALHEL